jgi:hypothetical protein
MQISGKGLKKQNVRTGEKEEEDNVSHISACCMVDICSY